MIRRIASGLALLLVVAPLRAQTAQEQALGTGVHFQGYEFNDSIGVSAANLLLVPIAYTLPLHPRVSVDLYGAYAHGAVEREGLVYTLDGVVDTRVRASWSVLPWAVFMVGANLPTGNPTHTGNEAVVAGALSTILLGFREASWGTGFALTSGIATAHRVGGWGIGFGASYRVAGEFEPRADTAVSYAPGDETLLRVALDRNLGESSKLTAGVTMQSYTADQLQGRNFFQSGKRWRGDASVSFRVGRSSVWSVYAADIWRERGDVTLDILDETGNVAADTTFTTGAQNLVLIGIGGSMTIAGRTVRPNFDARMQTREDAGGSGFLVGGGAELPFRISTFDAVPSARVSYGRLEAASGKSYPFWGGEAGIMLRRRIR